MSLSSPSAFETNSREKKTKLSDVECDQGSVDMTHAILRNQQGTIGRAKMLSQIHCLSSARSRRSVLCCAFHVRMAGFGILAFFFRKLRGLCFSYFLEPAIFHIFCALPSLFYVLTFAADHADQFDRTEHRIRFEDLCAPHRRDTCKRFCAQRVDFSSNI